MTNDEIRMTKEFSNVQMANGLYQVSRPVMLVIMV